jgi:hypothetical protein
MVDPRLLLFFGVIAVIFLFGGSIGESINNPIQTFFNGPEYCFRDISQSDISMVAEGVSVSYTKTTGDELCFRTKDSSIVERLNQQIQDRKLQAQLAQIESDRQFWNGTFPRLIFFGLIALILIVVIAGLYTNFSDRNQNGF